MVKMNNEILRRCYLYIITLAVICLLTLLYTTKIFHLSTLDRLKTVCTSKLKINAWLEEISNKQDLTNFKLYGDVKDNRAFEVLKSFSSLTGKEQEHYKLTLKTNGNKSEFLLTQTQDDQERRVSRESLLPPPRELDTFSEKLTDSDASIEERRVADNGGTVEETPNYGFDDATLADKLESTPLRYRKYGESWLMTKDELLLLRNWCIEHDYRINWRRILEPCKDKTVWSRHKPHWTQSNVTTAWRSYVFDTDIRPAGQYSRFFIQSVAQDGTKRQTGGDSWRVHIRGNEYVPVTVMDQKNGVYEVFFLITEPGKYSAEIVLDYTLCDGMKDPPVDWFIKGKISVTFKHTIPLSTSNPFIIE